MKVLQGEERCWNSKQDQLPSGGYSSDTKCGSFFHSITNIEGIKKRKKKKKRNTGYCLGMESGGTIFEEGFQFKTEKTLSGRNGEKFGGKRKGKEKKEKSSKIKKRENIQQEKQSKTTECFKRRRKVAHKDPGNALGGVTVQKKHFAKEKGNKSRPDREKGCKVKVKGGGGNRRKSRRGNLQVLLKGPRKE